MKTFLLYWLFGIATTTAVAVAPPPQIIEVEKPVYISNNTEWKETLEGLQSTYNRRIQSLTNSVSILERRIIELEKRPLTVQTIVEKQVAIPSQVPSSTIDIQGTFSSMDKRVASLEGRMGYVETSYLKVADSDPKFDLLNRQIRKICLWIAYSTIIKPNLHPDDIPRCEAQWW